MEKPEYKKILIKLDPYLDIEKRGINNNQNIVLKIINFNQKI